MTPESRNEGLTAIEAQHAAGQGWGLFHIYDQALSRWSLAVMSLDHPATSAQDTAGAVYELARQRDPVAIRALRLIMLSLQPQKKTTRKKK